MLSLLEDMYPSVYRFAVSVFPSAENDVITSPYNSVLATHELIEHAHCVLPVDNHALQVFSLLERCKCAKCVVLCMRAIIFWLLNDNLLTVAFLNFGLPIVREQKKKMKVERGGRASSSTIGRYKFLLHVISSPPLMYVWYEHACHVLTYKDA